MVKSKGTFPNFRIRLFCKSFLCIVTKLIQVRLFYHLKVQGGVFRLPLLSQEPYHNTKGNIHVRKHMPGEKTKIHPNFCNNINQFGLSINVPLCQLFSFPQILHTVVLTDKYLNIMITIRKWNLKFWSKNKLSSNKKA